MTNFDYSTMCFRIWGTIQIPRTHNPGGRLRSLQMKSRLPRKERVARNGKKFGSRGWTPVPGPEHNIPEAHSHAEIAIRKLVMHPVISLEFTHPPNFEIPMMVAVMHEGVINKPYEPAAQHRAAKAGARECRGDVHLKTKADRKSTRLNSSHT